MTTQADIQQHMLNGSWRALERFALEMVTDAAGSAKSDFQPLLVGGTRLMLAMQHRISDDIDLFIRDPQWIGYLTPRLNDRFEHQIDAYDEGATSLKIKLPMGEIDFIVSMSLLDLEPITSKDCLFSLEPVSEVLAKKLFYRGWALTPRDLFDWWWNADAGSIPLSKIVRQVFVTCPRFWRLSFSYRENNQAGVNSSLMR